MVLFSTSRRELRRDTGLPTGHRPLRHHLHRMDLTQRGVCECDSGPHVSLEAAEHYSELPTKDIIGYIRDLNFLWND